MCVCKGIISNDKRSKKVDCILLQVVFVVAPFMHSRRMYTIARHLWCIIRLVAPTHIARASL